MKGIRILCILLVSHLTPKAQSAHYAGIFPTIDHCGVLSNKFDYSLYYFSAFPLVNLQQPSPNNDARFLLFYSEQALTYKITGRFSGTLSYVYQRENAVYDTYVNENRFYIQTTYKHPVKKLNMKHRLRFDGRFIQNRLTGETPFTHRVRYLIGLDFSITDKLYFFAYEEAFFNTFANPGAVYGENWAALGLGLKINKGNKLELGPLYITWNTVGSNWFNQYYFQFTWNSVLDLRKNKS